ncbi:hypothetical protein DPMN_157855 [Dreissena polymorpha]|uniref:Uncharacterized protein n=1 Tax=Dreissena polymorpha TaxID=45954 RepID=A0A9D4EL68_DREPO|nr:hypothetical protein DPMN_157855 [Dreissena polymorpha]
MVSTLSFSYYDKMIDKPELRSRQDLNVVIICANGEKIPYLGYIEVLVKIPFSQNIEIAAPILIVPRQSTMTKYLQ